MPYHIIRTVRPLIDLERMIRDAGEYFQPIGQPFRDEETREWCQAGNLRDSPKPGETKLKGK